MYEKFGMFVVRRAKAILAASLLAVVGLSVYGFQVFPQLLSGGFDDPGSDSAAVTRLVDQDFGGSADLVFVVQAENGTVDDADARADAVALEEQLAEDPQLGQVTSYFSTAAPPLRSDDGRAALIVAQVAAENPQEAEADAIEILTRYADVDTDAINVNIGGPLGLNLPESVATSLVRAELIAVPLTLILLLVIFGGLVAASLPLLVSAVAIPGTFAFLHLMTNTADVSVFAVNLAIALGLGLGVDYALFIVSRFREQLARGNTVEQAVTTTIGTAGRTVVFSAIIVAIALSALLVFPVYFLKSFAYAGVAVVFFAGLAALMTLPAALTVLGHRVNAGRMPWVRGANAGDSPMVGRIARAVMRRPVLAMVPIVGILLFAATPLLQVSFGIPDDRVLPATTPAHVAGDTIRDDFSRNVTSPVEIIVTGSADDTELTEYAITISEQPGVAAVLTSSGEFMGGEPAGQVDGGLILQSDVGERMQAIFDIDPAGQEAQATVALIRDLPTPTGTEVLVGGSTAGLIDTQAGIASSLPLAVLIIIVSSFVVLFLFTGSVIQPIRAVLSNVLVLGASLGFMVLIFQMGFLQNVLGFTPTAVNISMPVLLFCIAFGLATDYEVFLMSRIKEERDQGVPNDEAVVQGLTKAGRIVGAAATVLAISLFAFGTADVSFLQFFGLGTGLAIVIDAILIRLFLLPAYSKLAGERAWWAPTPLRRLHDRIGVSDA